MEDVENVSYRETMVKFHASSIAQSYNELSKESVDGKLKNIFQKELNKKEKIRLLKGVQLTEPQLSSLFNFAEKCGYRFSHYKWQGDPKSVKEEKLPSFMHMKDDGSIEYIGETTLIEGQMRTIINQADVLIVRIFDNGSHWHCFLQTYKGLKGMESGVQGSRPHLHYLSDSFGISKADLVKMIKIGRYPNTPVNIPLLIDKSED